VTHSESPPFATRPYFNFKYELAQFGKFYQFLVKKASDVTPYLSCITSTNIPPHKLCIDLS
jgi:hypothetical protein